MIIWGYSLPPVLHFLILSVRLANYWMIINSKYWCRKTERLLLKRG